MTTVTTVLVNTKQLESSLTTQFTAVSKTIIDKCETHNPSTTNTRTATICIVPSGGSASSSNQLYLATLLPGETYLWPEITGNTLLVGDFISATADSATAVNFRVCGRLVS